MGYRCVIEAISKLIGATETSLELAVGHDGSQLGLWEDKPDRHRGFCVEEFIPYLLYLGYAFVPVWPELCIDGVVVCKGTLPSFGPGILCVPNHAIAIAKGEMVPQRPDWEVYWHVQRL